jgi:hypothetical protein
VWIHGYSQSAFLFGPGPYSPRYERQLPTTSSYIKVIADPVNPSTKPALEDPPTKVMNLIPGGFTRPDLNRILCTERMTKLKVPRQRDGIPNLLRGCGDR